MLDREGETETEREITAIVDEERKNDRKGVIECEQHEERGRE